MKHIRELVQDFKEENGIEMYDSLPPIIRVLLSADGTVTDILEAWCNTTVVVDKLYVPPAKSGDGSIRIVVLVDAASSGNLLYAVSKIHKNNLSETEYEQLLNNDEPIGKMLDRFKETTRSITRIEFMNPRREDAKIISQFLSIDLKDWYIERTYDILRDNKPIITINEVFNVRTFDGGF